MFSFLLVEVSGFVLRFNFFQTGLLQNPCSFFLEACLLQAPGWRMPQDILLPFLYRFSQGLVRMGFRVRFFRNLAKQWRVHGFIVEVCTALDPQII